MWKRFLLFVAVSAAAMLYGVEASTYASTTDPALIVPPFTVARSMIFPVGRFPGAASFVCPSTVYQPGCVVGSSTPVDTQYNEILFDKAEWVWTTGSLIGNRHGNLVVSLPFRQAVDNCIIGVTSTVAQSLTLRAKLKGELLNFTQPAFLHFTLAPATTYYLGFTDFPMFDTFEITAESDFQISRIYHGVVPSCFDRTYEPMIQRLCSDNSKVAAYFFTNIPLAPPNGFALVGDSVSGLYPAWTSLPVAAFNQIGGVNIANANGIVLSASAPGEYKIGSAPMKTFTSPLENLSLKSFSITIDFTAVSTTNPFTLVDHSCAATGIDFRVGVLHYGAAIFGLQFTTRNIQLQTANAAGLTFTYGARHYVVATFTAPQDDGYGRLELNVDGVEYSNTRGNVVLTPVQFDLQDNAFLPVPCTNPPVVGANSRSPSDIGWVNIATGSTFYRVSFTQRAINQQEAYQSFAEWYAGISFDSTQYNYIVSTSVPFANTGVSVTLNLRKGLSPYVASAPIPAAVTLLDSYYDINVVSSQLPTPFMNIADRLPKRVRFPTASGTQSVSFTLNFPNPRKLWGIYDLVFGLTYVQTAQVLPNFGLNQGINTATVTLIFNPPLPAANPCTQPGVTKTYLLDNSAGAPLTYAQAAARAQRGILIVTAVPAISNTQFSTCYAIARMSSFEEWNCAGSMIVVGNGGIGTSAWVDGTTQIGGGTFSYNYGPEQGEYFSVKGQCAQSECHFNYGFPSLAPYFELGLNIVPATTAVRSVDLNFAQSANVLASAESGNAGLVQSPISGVYYGLVNGGISYTSAKSAALRATYIVDGITYNGFIGRPETQAEFNWFVGYYYQVCAGRTTWIGIRYGDSANSGPATPINGFVYDDGPGAFGVVYNSAGCQASFCNFNPTPTLPALSNAVYIDRGNGNAWSVQAFGTNADSYTIGFTPCHKAPFNPIPDKFPICFPNSRTTWLSYVSRSDYNALIRAKVAFTPGSVWSQNGVWYDCQCNSPRTPSPQCYGDNTGCNITDPL